MIKKVFLIVFISFLMMLTGCTSDNNLPEDLQMPSDYKPDQVFISANVFASYASFITDSDDINKIVNEFDRLSFMKSDSNPDLLNLTSIHVGVYLYLIDSEGTVFVLDGILTQDNVWYQSKTQIDMSLFDDYLIN